LKIIGKILSVLAILCYILIAGVLFVAAPMVKGYKPVVVLTGSMAPTYPVGTVIYYKPAAFENIRVDDVITFSKSDDAKSVVTHRVFSIDTKRQRITTKGDANENPDPSPILYKNVKGKVMNYHLPYAGYVVKYVQNYWIIGAVFALLLAKLVYNRLAGREDDRKKQTAAPQDLLPPVALQQTPAQAPEWMQPVNTPPSAQGVPAPAGPFSAQPLPPAQEPSAQSAPPAFSPDVAPPPWAQDSPQEIPWDPSAPTQTLPSGANQPDVKQ